MSVSVSAQPPSEETHNPLDRRVVVLPLPDALPTDLETLATATRALASEGLYPALLRGPGGELAEARPLLEQANRRGEPAPPHALDEPAYEQDHFFGVSRTSQEASSVLATALLITVADAMDSAEQAGSGLSARDWGDLLGTADALFAVSPRGPGPRPRPCEGSPTADPRIRWGVGHRLFFTLTQAIIVSLRAFATATSRNDDESAVNALTMATAMTRGSTAALRFTADFAAREYMEVVRPSMMPPHAPPGFSGIQGVDHQVLVDLLRTLQPLFAALPVDQVAYKEYRQATHELYDAHEGICARFVGHRRPSLLMEARGGSSVDVSAIRVVQGLAERRMQLIEPPRASASDPAH